MAASRRLGRSALILGFLCCALSFANLVLGTKYGGMPQRRKIPFCDWCNHPWELRTVANGMWRYPVTLFPFIFETRSGRPGL